MPDVPVSIIPYLTFGSLIVSIMKKTNGSFQPWSIVTDPFVFWHSCYFCLKWTCLRERLEFFWWWFIECRLSLSGNALKFSTLVWLSFFNTFDFKSIYMKAWASPKKCVSSPFVGVAKVFVALWYFLVVFQRYIGEQCRFSWKFETCSLFSVSSI